MAKKKSLSAPKIGMSRRTHPSQLENTEYSFCLNCNTETEGGDYLNITNEPSNYFSVRFPEGYKVVGYKKHPNKDIVYYFLTNPITGFSSFGYVENIIGNLTYIDDTLTECPDCEYYNQMPTPLEETTQTPYNVYTELLNDLCNKAFNFSINHPIKHIEIKVEKLGTTLYFIDDYNPDRYINVDDIAYYQVTGDDVCGEGNNESVCVNVDRMLQHPNYTIPIITPEVIQIGGNLRMGDYQFLLAYCDKAGNEISEYTSITQPVKIFDENNRVLTQTELDSFTNFAIRLTVDNLDPAFHYYKVAVIERVSVNQAESYFEEGIHPITDKTIFYTSTQAGTENLGAVNKRISTEKLFAQKIKYDHTRISAVSGNQLFKFGLTAKKFPNLQPIVNLIGGFLKWQTGVAKEGLYKDGIATSKYRGYMREEVEPFALRFFNKDGTYYPLNPIISRPPKATDLEIISPSDKNLQSVLANSTDCTETDRNQRWQLFNTATVEGSCATVDGTEVEQEDTSSCVVLNIAQSDAGSLNIDDADDLKSYINNNLAEIIDPDSDKYIPEIAEYLTDTYPESCETTFSEQCDEPTLISTLVNVQEVENQGVEIIYDENVEDYAQNVPPLSCQPFQQNSLGEYIADEDFQTDYELTTVYKRQGNFSNQTCTNAVSVINNNNPEIGSVGYYHNYYGDLTAADLVDSDYTISATNANFYSGLHRGALWFKVQKNGRDKIVLELTSNSSCTTTDDIPEINQLRYSIFETCGSTESYVSEIVNTTEGYIEIQDVTDLADTFYIVIEAPIVETANTKYRTAPPCGCFSVLSRDLTVTGSLITYDSIIFQKIETYQATCTYEIPAVNGCDPIPYQYGEFAYWQSTETYPDNKELYDSSTLQIEEVDIASLTEAQKQQFRNYYTNGTSGSYFNLKDVDFRCQPIRLPKFPSNMVSPFMGTISSAPFAESLIFPLGVTLDNDIVNAFLDIAVKNNLLTQAQRNDIAGYEVLKGDNSLHKSIVANTIGFDMYKYTEKGYEVLYPNYPLNDLGDDILHLENGNDIEHPYEGVSNHNFSLLSPDLLLNKPTVPTEIIISGYQQGNSRIRFEDVEEYPRYTVMTSRAKDLAGILAGAEVALEIATKLAELTVNSGIGQQWFITGVSTGTNAIGAGLSSTAIGLWTGAQTIQSLVRAGQYRLQWLQTIENLGPRNNHSAYCVSEGYHNKFLQNTLNTDLVRGISASKYIDPGKFTFKDEHTGDTIKINNTNREKSLFISLQEQYDINYPAAYYNYDNNTLGSQGSRAILSENDNTVGEEIIRNSAVPYITLKNYIPNQFGTIDSIKWLSTSYRSYLDTDNSCETIYGGTVYLCRDYQERKHPIFRTDSFPGADLTPFKHSDYKNVGRPKYYVDFHVGGQRDGGFGFLFPDIETSHQFDNPTRDGFYYTSASKFYLYYYGFASYIVESEINTDYRYGRREIRDQYYPDIQGDMVEFTQQKNRRITEVPTYFYNSVYSRGVSQLPYNFYPAAYEKEVYDKINDSENGVIYSLVDSTQNDLSDPWLTYLPLNRFEFDSEKGKLISVESLGSDVLLARFENGDAMYNAIDTIQTNNPLITAELGTGGVFAKRPLESDAGTQNTDALDTTYGLVTVDAKRGKVHLRSGQEIIAISDILGNKESGLKNWLRQHLPFKILRDFPQTDIDNKYKGIGISLGFDNKTGRIFVTKKDYKVINKECLEYDPELGFVVNESLCGQDPEITCPSGYTYNSGTQMCERQVEYTACPDGYSYNPITGMCETEGSSTLMCPVGYTYDPETGLCNADEEIVVAETCGAGCTIIEQPDGNAMCICPAQEIDSLCTNCDVDIDFRDCGEGYTYNENTGMCVKTITQCPPSEGIYVGGVFTTPDARLYNSVSNVLNVNNNAVRRIKRQIDGKLLVCGSFTSTAEGTINGLLRLNVDGSLDNTFDIGTGFANTVSSMNVSDVDVDSQGRIIVVGSFTTFDGQTNNNAIIRLNSDGSKDTTFNNATGFTSAIGQPAGELVATVKVVENDKILVGCSNINYKGQPGKGVIKINVDGSIDTSFNGGNRFNSFVFSDSLTGINGTNNWNGEVRAIEVQENGYYLLGGNFNEYNGVLSRRLIRIKPNGDIDFTFNVGAGFLDIATYSYQCYIYKVQMQGDKILAAGRFKTYKGQSVEGIVRLLNNGNLDPTFNNAKVIGGADAGGRVINDFDTNTEGEILMGGFYTSYDGNGIDNYTLTTVNGFATSFTDLVFNSFFGQSIYAVLNEPRCEECESESCTQVYLGDGLIECQCPPSASVPTCVCVDQTPPIVVPVLTPVYFDNEDYFQDASWTLAIRPQNGWISYMSYNPDYYSMFSNFYETGYNFGEDKETLWTHPLNPRSHQVFQGRRYPFIVEYPVVNENVAKTLESISANVEARHFNNEYDSTDNSFIGFNKATIYNNTNNSGLLNLNLQRSLSDVRNYPQSNTNSQDILYTSENGAQKINYFYNRVINQNNNVPHWIWDINQINKNINTQAISFRGKRTLERMRGEYFFVRLTQDKTSQYQILLKTSIQDESVEQ